MQRQQKPFQEIELTVRWQFNDNDNLNLYKYKRDLDLIYDPIVEVIRIRMKCDLNEKGEKSAKVFLEK